MPRSAQLRSEDLKAMATLLGECREQGDDPALWWAHLAQGIGRLTGSHLVLGGEVAWTETGTPRILGTGEWGWEFGFNRDSWALSMNAFEQDPFYTPILQRYFEQQAPGSCCSRTELLRDRDWYRSWHYEQVIAPMTIDHVLWCFTPFTHANSRGHVGFSLGRVPKRRDYSMREKALVRDTMRGIAAITMGSLASYSTPSPSKLPAYLRRTLRCLLEGDSDKQIAARLVLSITTVRGYVREVLRHYGVGSRTELVSHWVRRRYSTASGEVDASALPLRARQVLECFLQGDGDRETALRLGITRHTVNQYAKRIYAHFGVSSRLELLSLWVRKSGYTFLWAGGTGFVAR